MGKIAEYLKNYTNESTMSNYVAAVHTFIDFIYGKQRVGRTASEEEKQKYEKLVDKYIKEKRNYAEDMAAFAVSLHSRAPLSARVTFNNVMGFFSYYDVVLSTKDEKFTRRRLPKGNVRTIEKDMDTDTIRTILQHVDIKGKALILVLASSGLRINEALTLPLEDVDLNAKPAVITIRGENAKNGDNRITFMSAEAVQAVNEWLKVRPDYIRAAANKNNGLIKSGRGSPKTTEDDGRLFPFTDQTASVLWDNALTKAGLLSRDKSTNRKQLHYHQFRKFFISQLALIVSKEVPETLAGHEGYLTDAYRRYTKKQLAEEYLKGQHLLTIQAPKELQEMESEFKAKMQTHSDIIESLVKKNLELDKKNSELEQDIVIIKEEQERIRAMTDTLQKLMDIDTDAQAIFKSQ
jgi:integrase/exonuclease VII small subunit